MESQGTPNRQNHLDREQSWRLVRHDFKARYKAFVTKLWYQHKDKHIDQRKRHSRSQLLHIWLNNFFDKGAKAIQWGGESILFNESARKTISIYKRIKLGSYLIPYTGINSIKDLNVRPETIKLSEENLGEKLPHHWIWQRFHETIQKAQATKGKKINHTK